MIVVDNSTLKLTECTTRAILRRHLGYTTLDEAVHAKCGHAVHAALARYLVNGEAGPALDLFDAEYEAFSNQWVQPKTLLKYGQQVEVPNRIRHANVRDVLGAWLTANPVPNLPWVPNELEHPMRAQLAPYVWYAGRLDVLGIDHSGRLVVVDHKTTGALHSDWWAQWQLDAGCTGYLWLASQALGKPVNQIALYINAIELSELPKSNRTCKQHGVPHSECYLNHARWGQQIFTRTEEQVEEWRATATRMALRYRAQVTEYESTHDVRNLPQEGTVTGACRVCDFKRFCSARRPLHLMDVLLQHEPWEPWEGAFTIEETKE